MDEKLLEFAIEWRTPFPIAKAIHRVFERSEEKVLHLNIAFESTLKFCTFILISEYLSSPLRTEANDRKIKEFLRSPLTGGKARDCILYITHNVLKIPMDIQHPFIKNIISSARQKQWKHRVRELLDEKRNPLTHGYKDQLKFEAPQYQQKLFHWLRTMPWLMDVWMWYPEKCTSHDHSVVYEGIDLRGYVPQKIRVEEPSSKPSLVLGHIVLVVDNENGTFALSLHPFYIWAICCQCKKEQFWSFHRWDGQRVILKDNQNHNYHVEWIWPQRSHTLHPRIWKSRWYSLTSSFFQPIVRKGDIVHKRYIIEDGLGQGGMGSVFSAWDKKTGRKCAIKFISPWLLCHRGLQRRFEQEYAIASSIHHPNIIQAYARGAYEGIPYWVMELADGWIAEDGKCYRDLDHFPKPVELSLFYRIALQMCEAVSALHAQNIIHRDIKPANFLLFSSGIVKLTDFGICRLLDSVGMTVPGQTKFLGTPDFASPEQMRYSSTPVGPHSDVYSLGVVFYLLLTGQKPIWRNKRLQSILSLRKDCPQDVADCVHRCLQENPKKRPHLTQIIALFRKYVAAHSSMPQQIHMTKSQDLIYVLQYTKEIQSALDKNQWELALTLISNAERLGYDMHIYRENLQARVSQKLAQLRDSGKESEFREFLHQAQQLCLVPKEHEFQPKRAEKEVHWDYMIQAAKKEQFSTERCHKLVKIAQAMLEDNEVEWAVKILQEVLQELVNCSDEHQEKLLALLIPIMIQAHAHKEGFALLGWVKKEKTLCEILIHMGKMLQQQNSRNKDVWEELFQNAGIFLKTKRYIQRFWKEIFSIIIQASVYRPIELIKKFENISSGLDKSLKIDLFSQILQYVAQNHYTSSDVWFILINVFKEIDDLPDIKKRDFVRVIMQNLTNANIRDIRLWQKLVSCIESIPNKVWRLKLLSEIFNNINKLDLNMQNLYTMIITSSYNVGKSDLKRIVPTIFPDFVMHVEKADLQEILTKYYGVIQVYIEIYIKKEMDVKVFKKLTSTIKSLESWGLKTGYATCIAQTMGKAKIKNRELWTSIIEIILAKDSLQIYSDEHRKNFTDEYKIFVNVLENFAREMARAFVSDWSLWQWFIKIVYQLDKDSRKRILEKVPKEYRKRRFFGLFSKYDNT